MKAAPDCMFSWIRNLIYVWFPLHYSILTSKPYKSCNSLTCTRELVLKAICAHRSELHLEIDLFICKTIFSNSEKLILPFEMDLVTQRFSCEYIWEQWRAVSVNG